MSSFMDCKKIVDTPFPFPYAQCVFVALLVYAVSTPIQNGLAVDHAPSACILTFVARRPYILNPSHSLSSRGMV